MTAPPSPLLVFHITHVTNLPSIIAAGGLLSDKVMIANGAPQAAIGMSAIKQRRLSLPVSCHPGDHVGDYVPFYFCPRSVMLYVIHCKNHPQLAYRGGQEPIVHLVAELDAVVNWANAIPRRWAFSLSNAGAHYTQFFASLGDLNRIEWADVAATDFRPSNVREAKQAEFLLHDGFPWGLVTKIGVHSIQVQNQVVQALANATHKPPVLVEPSWYY